jgi:OOP family OmpA-OmpF porin
MTCLLTTLASAQSYNKWSVNVGFGNHFGMNPASAKTRLYQMQTVGAGGRYMFNQYIGVMLTGTYDFLDFDGMGSNNQQMVRTDIQGVINIGNLCNFQKKTKTFGLLFHAGIGGTHLFSKSSKQTDARDPLFKNTDDMFNVAIGLTPQFKLHSRISLFVDYTLLANFKQDYAYDFSSKLTGKGIGGNLHSLMIGLRFNLGPNANHIDWAESIAM